MSDEPKVPNNEYEKQESAKDTELRQQSHPDFPLPPKKNKSKKNVVFLVVLMLVIVAIAVAAFVALAIPKLETEKKTTDKTSYSSATKYETAKALISDVSAKLSGPTVEVSQYDGFGGKTADGFGAYSVPTYKVGDRKYSNLPADSVGSSYKGTSAEEAANYDTLTAYFSNNKFKKLTSGENSSGINQWFSQNLNYVKYASYESSDMLCMIWHVDATPTAIKNHVTSVGCASKTSYEAAAKQLDQFYTAYAKDSTNSGSERVVLGMPTGSNGADSYVNATVYQEDPDQLSTQFQGLYYKANKDQKDWTYFTGAYGLLSCTEYNTDVLKKAFKDFSCYNDATKTYATVI